MRLLSRCSSCTLAFLVVALSACGDDQGHTSPTETVAPTIAALALSADSVLIGGSNTPLTVTIDNPAPDRPNVTVEGYLTQGTARRAAGSMQVDCGSGAALLPKGTCTVSFALGASNGGAGTGTLVQGAATFELQLTQNGMVLATKIAAVTLVNHPTISAVKLGSDTAMIGGPGVGLTTTIESAGPSLPGVSVQGYVTQGTARRAVGSIQVDCGSGTAVLPRGTCPVSFVAGASNSGTGTGTLVAGDAAFELQLIQKGTVLDTKTVAVTLVEGPTISALSLSSDSVTIDGPNVNYTAALVNPGSSYSNMVVRGYIHQGTVQHVAGGTNVFACGSDPGVLPKGTCPVLYGFGASNSGGAGTGLLVQGAATFELRLTRNDTVVLDTKTVAVTLVSNKPPRISALTLSSDTATIGGSSVPYNGNDPKYRPDRHANAAADLHRSGNREIPRRREIRRLRKRCRGSADRHVHGSTRVRGEF